MKRARLSLDLPPLVKRKLERLARKERRTITDYVRRWIEAAPEK